VNIRNIVVRASHLDDLVALYRITGRGRMTPRHSLSAEYVDDCGNDSVGLDLTP
jgi:hypothetical protein